MILYIFRSKYIKLHNHEIVKKTLKTSAIHILSYARLKELLSMGTNVSSAYVRNLIH